MDQVPTDGVLIEAKKYERVISAERNNEHGTVYIISKHRCQVYFDGGEKIWVLKSSLTKPPEGLMFKPVVGKGRRVLYQTPDNFSRAEWWGLVLQTKKDKALVHFDDHGTVWVERDRLTILK
jgi:hypothetical protein